MTAAYSDFVARYPEYLQTEVIDRLRATEYRRLDEQQQVYLDYTGGSLYAESQVAQHLDMLRDGVFGNPHSANPTSMAMTDRVEGTRQAVLDYFNAARDYIAVFTLNATGALKLAGEAFPFTEGSRYLSTFDNHNSVVGIRQFALARGATVAYAPMTRPDLRVNGAALEELLEDRDPARENLFAYPAQSNFSGVKHSLNWVVQAQRKGWRVLLDAAAFVPTNRLDLSAVKPDFVCVSFYKMFGYPAGVGALLIRRETLSGLKRPWFAGGTVNFVSVQGRVHVLSGNEAGFEDGTLNYLSIPGVEIGLRHLESIGIETIAERVRCLTGWLLEELTALRHGNGRAMVRIYGPATTEARGGTVTFNLHDPDGCMFDYRRVEELAGEAGISLRTGCFCNPGASEAAEGLTEDDFKSWFAMGADLNLPNLVRQMGSQGKSAGAVRASIGLATNFEDVRRFLDFVKRFRDQTRLAVGGPNVSAETCRVIRDGS